jgi:hypothetical protein
LLDGHHVHVHAPIEQVRIRVRVVDEPEDFAVGQEQEPRTVVAPTADAGQKPGVRTPRPLNRVVQTLVRVEQAFEPAQEALG